MLQAEDRGVPERVVLWQCGDVGVLRRTYERIAREQILFK